MWSNNTKGIRLVFFLCLINPFRDNLTGVDSCFISFLAVCNSCGQEVRGCKMLFVDQSVFSSSLFSTAPVSTSGSYCLYPTHDQSWTTPKQGQISLCVSVFRLCQNKVLAHPQRYTNTVPDSRTNQTFAAPAHPVRDQAKNTVWRLFQIQLRLWRGWCTFRQL